MSIDCKCLHCLNLAMGDEITKLRRERDEARRLAGVAEMRLKKAEEVVMLARQLTSYSWVDRLEDCKVSDDAKHDSRELGIAIWLYDQDPVTGASGPEDVETTAERAAYCLRSLKAERDEARRLAGEAKQQLDRDLGFSMHDWACVECWPESESLIDGFRCARHAIPTEWVPAKGGKP